MGLKPASHRVTRQRAQPKKAGKGPSQARRVGLPRSAHEVQKDSRPQSACAMPGTRAHEQQLQQQVADATARLSTTAPGGASAMQLRLRANDDVLTPAQAKALSTFRLDAAAQKAFLSGQTVTFSLPAITGHDTIGTLRLTEESARCVCISVHDERNGFKVLTQMREYGRELARAFERDAIDFGGAAVINPRIQKLLDRQGFTAASHSIPDELGNIDDMTVYMKRFEVRDAS